MGAPPPAPGFDQDLFLGHFDRGREAFDAKRFEDAARELQEAYLLRPRDLKVLNLLGLTYFKQDRYDKAEEIYRKLVAESPEAPTLHYNLGLIYFKLSRLEESESCFLKAQELAEDNPKIGFYLGSIYERQRRFQDAIFQYRQAGANIMVRRVEDHLAAGAAPGPRPRLGARPGGHRPLPLRRGAGRHPAGRGGPAGPAGAARGRGRAHARGAPGPPPTPRASTWPT